MRIKDPKIFIVLVPFVAVVSIISSLEKNKPIDFKADGRVAVVKPVANHGKPIVTVRFEAPPYTRQFFPTKSFVEKSKIKIGDHFVKEKNSKHCLVNGKKFQCL